MNAYAVAINEVRETYDYYQIDPPEPYLPIGVFAAETRAQAKYDALREFSRGIGSGVFSDDWPSLRTRLLARNVRRPRGEYSGTDSIWGLIPRGWPLGGAAAMTDTRLVSVEALAAALHATIPYPSTWPGGDHSKWSQHYAERIFAILPAAPAEAGLREARLRAAMAEAMTATFGLASDGVSTALRRAFADHVVAALAAQEGAGE